MRESEIRAGSSRWQTGRYLVVVVIQALEVLCLGIERRNAELVRRVGIGRVGWGLLRVGVEVR